MLRFLLIDDDPIFLAVAECVVTSLGNFEAVTASNGSFGLAALQNRHSSFDYIILDLNMPDMDGLAFLRRIASDGYGGNIIISSGENDAVIRSASRLGEMLKLNIVGALQKPLDPDTLLKLVNLQPAKQATESTVNPPPTVFAEDLDLVPYYQAQHDIESGRIVGLEGLIRVRDRSGAIHGPAQLLASLDRHEKLLGTSLRIAGKFLDDVAAWKTRGLTPRVSINLDARVAEEPSTGQALVEMIRSRDLQPAHICVELTETTFPAEMARLVESMTRLRMAGVELSLDDYGTGVANFELLRSCPFSEIKIDGSILRSAPVEQLSRQFVRSTVAMARDLDIVVVGEGVETSEQIDCVRQLGISVVQGFFFSRPVPADHMVQMLLAENAPTSRAC